ncbi:single-stranded DNA-binding protein [Bacillus sp. NPDC094106]|uniref:single-stranded DNA-binding protein n=1 Tax=Bacillus sp. NPDC094106 TaxID=3363949 RepID=UPI0037F5A512
MNEHLKTKWIRPEDTVERREKLQALRKAKELKHLADCVLEILYNRGFDTVEKIESFLHMDITDIHNPQLMKDSDKAVSLLIHAIEHSLHIVVYGDYDCGATRF